MPWDTILAASSVSSGRMCVVCAAGDNLRDIMIYSQAHIKSNTQQLDSSVTL